VRSEQGALPIPRRDADHSRKANRVQSSTGSRNARWRRESGGGNTDPPEADNLRVSAEKAEHEKLNDEGGVKPLPVNDSRDGAECGNDGSGRIGGRFCILAPEISAPVALETMTRREPRTCLTGPDERTFYPRDCWSEESD
jgi:hypothetical protein